jgi:DNA-binding protein
VLSKNIIKRNVRIITLAALLAVMGTAYASAGVIAQPDSTELIVTKINPTTGNIQVRNDGAETITVTVDVEDWLKNRRIAKAIPVNAWLLIDPAEFTLGPSEAKDVSYTINVPSDCEEPELVAMVFFGAVSKQGTLNITNRYGVSVYAAISDKLTVKCKIADVKIERYSVDTGAGKTDNKGLIFNIDVQNDGSAHLRPTGDIIITDEKGVKHHAPVVRDFPVYPRNHLIQKVIWSRPDIVPGKYEAFIELDYGKLYNIDGKLQTKIYFTISADGDISIEGDEANAKS